MSSKRPHEGLYSPSRQTSSVERLEMGLDGDLGDLGQRGYFRFQWQERCDER